MIKLSSLKSTFRTKDVRKRCLNHILGILDLRKRSYHKDTIDKFSDEDLSPTSTFHT